MQQYSERGARHLRLPGAARRRGRPLVRRANARPDASVAYATNLLTVGVVEDGADGKPAGWSYVGKAEWCQDVAYAGKGSLLNVSVDPPLSRNLQWYGRSPIDGFWLSDPMPCEADTSYVAAARIRPGMPISEPWHGPLEIRFYNAAGKVA